MNPILKTLLIPFLNDMADVGISKWGLMTAFFGVLTYAFYTGSYFLLDWVLALIMFINVGVALGVTIWWEYRGREKYASTTILDLADSLEMR